MKTQHLHHTFIALLLRAWEQEGHRMGTGEWIRVQQLLSALPPDYPHDRLCHALTALLARSEAEQARLYVLMAQCAQQADALCADPHDATALLPDEAVTQAQAGERRWWYRLWPPALLLLALAAMALWQYLRPEVRPPAPRALRIETAACYPGDTLRLPLHRDTAALLRAEPTAPIATAVGNTYYIDSTGVATYTAAPQCPTGRTDTLMLYLHYTDGTDSVQWRVQLDSLAAPAPISPAPDLDSLYLVSIPYSADLTPLRIDAARVQRYEWFRRYEWPLKGLALVLGAALSWALLRLWQYRRARVVAELRQSSHAPYLWQPAAAADASEWMQDAAQPLLNRFRGRAPDDLLRLDLSATVAATVRRAGRVSFQYRRRTLPPAYLLLIDRHGADDHRARLFDTLHQAMLAAEVPVSRYYYNGDPRLCYNEAHPHGITLVELQHRHTDTRLLMVGAGQGLLSLASGRVAPWAALLEAWGHRALLSTRARSEWGLPEQELAKLLLLLPATEQGLALALEAFLAEERPTQQQVMEALRTDAERGVQFQGDLLQDLRARYDQPALDWIAACAVWPTLHWDLTLHLGQCMADHHGLPLLSFERLRTLGLLPWFAQGRMPERARLLLLDYLRERGLEDKVRQALRDLLAQSAPPPPDAVAYGDYRMNLILNELMLRPDAATRRRLEQEFADWMAAGKQPDFVALRLLDRPASRLDVLVGNRLKKYAFREGLPSLGWANLPKLLGLWLLLALALLLLRPDLRPCTGTTASYQGQALCLATAQDSLLLWRVLAGEAVQTQDTAAIDSLQALTDALVPTGDTAFYRNTAAHHYNYGLTHREDTARSACRNFSRAQTLAERMAAGGEPLYRLALQRHCPEETGTGTVDTATFTLTGRILDAATGQPIPNATLRLAPADRITDAQLRQGRAKEIRTATTDAQGRYALADVPLTTQLQLYATATDYTPVTRRDRPSASLPDLRLQPTEAARERAAWAKATAANTPEAYSTYLVAHPDGPNAAEAKSRQQAGLTVRERAAWDEAQRTHTIVAYERYKTQHPNGVFVPQADAAIRTLQAKAAADAAIAANTIAAYDAFLNGSHASSEHAPDLRRRRDALQEADDYRSAAAANTAAAYDVYLGKWPNGTNAAEARRRSEALAPAPATPDPIRAIAANMVRVPGSTFTMGCLKGRDEPCDSDGWEEPTRPVRVPAFSISKYEVTQAQWRAVMGSDPEELHNKGCDDCPVENVSWNDIQDFLRKLNALTGERYRLPTEAEWEYAARGGAQSRGFLYSGSKNIDEVAWYTSNYKQGNTHGTQKTTRPVGQKKANELGLYDMSGNVWEWVEDDSHSNYNGAPTDGRAWVDSPRGSYRVIRGGSWNDYPRYCRAAYRDYWFPTYRYFNVGFRLARS